MVKEVRCLPVLKFLAPVDKGGEATLTPSSR